MNLVRLVLAQLNPVVGDLDGNASKIIQAGHRAQQEYQADMMVVPEQALIGYPAEDLLLQPQIGEMCDRILNRIIKELSSLCLVIGYPRPAANDSQPRITNHAAVFHHGECLASYAKQYLPNYQVFDEKRYFQPGKETCVFSYKGVAFGLLICEDLWYREPIAACRKAGAQHIISLNASPYNIHQPQKRLALILTRAKEQGLPISYVNCCGGQDELVFDGHSFACNHKGEILTNLGGMKEGFLPVLLDRHGTPQPGPKEELLTKTAEIYEVLKLGLRDYVDKNGFQHCVLGLSGGIDSALVLCLAADTLSPERVSALIMPSQYTAAVSIKDAIQLAKNLGVQYEQISIDPLIASCKKQFEGRLDLEDDKDIAVQNIQPRCRLLLLMAWANKKSALLLATSNKSESAVGYTTLYGDMAGGFSPIKDVFKSRVYELANYRNQIDQVIPTNILTRPPTAELHAGQLDQDSLPDYPLLDRILAAYVEEALGPKEIIARGYDAKTTIKVIAMVDAAEHKRRQAAIGTRISEKGFGRDRRYPITQRYGSYLSKI